MYGYATPFWRHFHVVFDVLDLNLSIYDQEQGKNDISEITPSSG